MGIKNLFKKEVKVVSEVTPESMRENRIIQTQQLEIQSLKAQIGKMMAKERDRHPETEEDLQAEDMVKEINEQDADLKKEMFGKTFSHRQFWAKVLGADPDDNSDFGERIEITDKNGDRIFGYFHDIINLPNGYFGITDKKHRLISYGRTWNGILWKPDSLGNTLKKGFIHVALTKDGEYAPDIESEEVPDMVYDDKEKIWRKTEAYTATFEEHLIRRDKQIQTLHKKLERVEALYAEAKVQIDDKERTIKTLEMKTQNSQSHLSQVMNKFAVMDGATTEMQNKIAHLSEYKAFMEKQNNAKDNIINDLIRSIEDKESKIAFELAWARLQDQGEYWKSILPQKEIKIQESPQFAMPNQPIKMERGSSSP